MSNDNMEQIIDDYLYFKWEVSSEILERIMWIS